MNCQNRQKYMKCSSDWAKWLLGKTHCKRIVLGHQVLSYGVLGISVLIILRRTGRAWWDVGPGMGLVVEFAISFPFRFLTWKVSLCIKNNCADHLNHHYHHWQWGRLFAPEPCLGKSMENNITVFKFFFFYSQPRIAKSCHWIVLFFASTCQSQLLNV